VDPVGSGQGPVAGSCKYGDTSAGSGATELDVCYTPQRRLGGRRYSYYLLSTSALDGGKWPASRPVSMTPGNRCTVNFFTAQPNFT
jgi:hypothetical protein